MIFTSDYNDLISALRALVLSFSLPSLYVSIRGQDDLGLLPYVKYYSIALSLSFRHATIQILCKMISL